jgi:hypothetical protein
MAPIYGISGRARSGKDTVGAFIKATAGGYTYSLAEPLRRMLNAGFGMNMHDKYWRDRKEEATPAFGGRSPRHLMQTLGTDWGRNLVSEDLWVNLCAHQFRLRGPGMIVTDVRFENEARWIRSMGGQVLHISRPQAEAVQAHVSESGVVAFPDDWQVVNDSTLEQLMLRLRQLLTP